MHVASHDLQEPLRKIAAFASRITEQEERLSEEETKMYLNKIKSSSTRMSELIKNILNYALLSDQGQLFEKTDLNLILKEVLVDF